MSIYTWQSDHNSSRQPPPPFATPPVNNTSTRSSSSSYLGWPSSLFRKSNNQSNGYNGNAIDSSVDTAQPAISSYFQSRDSQSYPQRFSQTLPTPTRGGMENTNDSFNVEEQDEDGSSEASEGRLANMLAPLREAQASVHTSVPPGGRETMTAARAGEREQEGINSRSGNNDDDEDDNENNRKHGKRLTTKEEVSLFEICNRYADSFGQRSKLCEWWMTVTKEFTRRQGHPYSWHSVRRKVELVTKQRIKFLEEQGSGAAIAPSEDYSNPQWRAAVDSWIPTWRRWEETEAKRIERRDSRRPRKRKQPSSGPDFAVDTDYSNNNNNNNSSSSSRAAASRFEPLPTPSRQRPGTTTTTTTTNTNPAARLPPGFDSIFPNSNRHQIPNANPYTAATTTTTPTPTSSTPFPSSSTDATVIPAILETLGKLNKHLDSHAPNPRSSPVISALVSNADPQSSADQAHHSSGNSAISLEALKDDLRLELSREMEKDRSSLQEKLDDMQRNQQMILDMLTTINNGGMRG